MTGTFEEAPDEVIEIAQYLIAKYHPHLKSARIGFVMRDKAPKLNGRIILGYARKVSQELQLHVPFDFIITLSTDEWENLSSHQQHALIDHELCHCWWDGLSGKVRAHDIEEFLCIFERYGFWRPRGSKALAEAVQAALEFPVGNVSGGVSKVRIDDVVNDFFSTIKSMEADGVTVTLHSGNNDVSE